MSDLPTFQEIDCCDGNPKTRIFVVPIAQALEFPIVPVTVKAHLNPNLTEDEVPAGWTLQGGIGSEKLTRIVNRSVMAGPSKTEFIFSYDGIDSGFKTTIYVYDAKVGLFADNGGENSPDVGHSWAGLSIDSYAEELIREKYLDYLNYIGFWPSIAGCPDCQGSVRLKEDAVGPHFPTGQKLYPILFNKLENGLSSVDTSYNNPPWYNLFIFNCTDYAIWVGEQVDVPTMDPAGVSTPWEFSGWLNSH